MRKKACDVFADILTEYGIEYVYGIPGATEIYFMDALERNDRLKYILGLNELTCVSMAEGYCRASGKPAVLNMHTSVGMAAAMPLLVNCKQAHVPVIVTVGDNDSRFLNSQPQLTGDIVGMGKTVAKYSVGLNNAEELPQVLHRAVKTALQPPMGPVVVSIPVNLLNEEIDYEPRPVVWPQTRQRGDAQAIAKAAELIKAAKNPVMIVEEGVAISGALAETVRLAELAGAPVYQIWMADINFPPQHPLYCGDLDSTGEKAQKIFAESDLLIAVGCQVFNDAFYSGRKIIHGGMKIVHIADDPWEVGKNFITDAGIVGDPKTVLTELNALLEGDEALETAAKERTAAITKQTDAAKAALAAKIADEADHKPIAPSHIMNCLKNVLPEGAIVLDDCWSSSGMLRSILDLKDGKALTRPRNGGSIGFGPGGALGVKQGAPERPVVAVIGDGSAAWGMQSFWSAAHYNIPVTFIITNNGTYRQVKNVRKVFMGDYDLTEPHLGMELENPRVDFTKLAESMGVPGVKVYEPSELEEVMKKAIASGKLNLIEVYTENAPK